MTTLNESRCAHGWVRASAAKIQQYNREGRPPTEFWVPQSDLHPFTAKQP